MAPVARAADLWRAHKSGSFPPCRRGIRPSSPIAPPANDGRLAAYRNVRDGDLLRTKGLFVAEGRIVVKRVIDDRRYVVQSVLVNDAALKDLEPTLAALAADVPILVCRAGELAAAA